MLHKLATGAGATILCNSEVVSIQPGSAGRAEPSVTLGNGDILTADLIVGADGSQSMTRDVVLDEEDCSEPLGLTVYSGVVNGDDIRRHPQLGPRLQKEEVCIDLFIPLTVSLIEVSSGPYGWGTE